MCFCCCLSVCLLASFCNNFQTHFHEIFREGWQWAVKQMVKFRWRSGSLSGCRGCFPDLSLLGDTESGVNRLHCAMLQCTACTGRHRHSNCDVITSPAHYRLSCRSQTVSLYDGTDVATLVRRALVQVCTVPVLLVIRMHLSVGQSWKGA